MMLPWCLEVGRGPRFPRQEGEQAAGRVAGRVRDPLQRVVHQNTLILQRRVFFVFLRIWDAIDSWVSDLIPYNH